MPVREISGIPSDVISLARRVTDRPGLAVLASDTRGALREEDARFSFVACDPVDDSDAWVPETPADASCRDRGWAAFPAAPRWIGAIPYEAGRHLERRGWSRPETRPPPPMMTPRWLRYDAVARVDRFTGRVVVEADTSAAADRLVRLLSRADMDHAARDSIELRRDGALDRDDGQSHISRVRQILDLIAGGDVYQVNLARCMTMRAVGAPSAVFEALFKGAPSPYGCFIDFGGLAVCGTSPELALEVRGDALRTMPIKGTRPRGACAASDVQNARDLDDDPKERAELTMAMDLHRNDLGKVAAFGSIRVRSEPRVVESTTLFSRVAEIVARRAPGWSLDAIARAVLPSGSVTGAPKVRAMEIIADLEPFRRGLYTGTYGYVGRDGALVLAMAIRTLEITADGRARYCTGGGIVDGSDPLRELEETRWKAAQLDRLVAPAKIHRNLAERRM